MTTATLNDQYPGATPAGTEVEVKQDRGQLFIRVGRKDVKVSPRWLDMPEPERLVPRRLRVREGMWS